MRVLARAASRLSASQVSVVARFGAVLDGCEFPEPDVATPPVLLGSGDGLKLCKAFKTNPIVSCKFHSWFSCCLTLPALRVTSPRSMIAFVVFGSAADGG